MRIVSPTGKRLIYNNKNITKQNGYLYFKLIIEETRDSIHNDTSQSQGHMQLSEFELYENLTKISLTAIQDSGHNASDSSKEHLVDNNTSTKWCILNFNSHKPAWVILQASKPCNITKYRMATCNDSKTWYGRNPINWSIYGSNDCINWELITKRVNDGTLQPVNEKYYEFNIKSQITINGHNYGIVKVGNQYWINENLNVDISQNTYHYQNYGAYYTVQELNEGIPQLLESLGITGWHVPTITDTNKMIDYIVQLEGLSSRNQVGKFLLRTDQAGSIGDTYGLGFLLTGSYDGRSTWERVTEAGNYSDMGEQSDNNTYMNRMYFSTNATDVDTWGNGSEAITRKYCTRLIYVE